MLDGRWRRRPALSSLVPVAGLVALQTTTPGGDVGPEELVEAWPAVVRAAWFSAGFLVVVLVGWYLVAPGIRRAVGRRNPNNATLNEAITRYVRAGVLIVGVVVGATLAGYGGFLGNSAIVIAAVTLAIGVAGQEVIGSLVSGLALVVDPEFNVGDYIEWDGGEGTVRSITLRVTRVQTPSGELLTVPNTVLTDGTITRPFGRGRLRVEERVGIDYGDDVAEALSLLVGAARDEERILGEPSPGAYVDELGDDEITIEVHYWIEDPSRREVNVVRSAYARSILNRLDAAGIEISPAAQRDLQGRIAVDEEA